MQQTTFVSFASSHAKKHNKWERFRRGVDQAAPWARLAARIEPHYPGAGHRRQPMPLQAMPRPCVLQQYLNLSDLTAEGTL